jgi:IclR family transcriptional regulator, acetate operon repressor
MWAVEFHIMSQLRRGVSVAAHPSESTGTQSVDRACDLLARVIRAEASLTSGELADASELPRSTTSRLLSALERANLLTRAEAGGWAPGGLFDLYASRRTDEDALARAAAPMMRSLGDATGETVNLGVARHGTVIQLAQIDATFRLGSRDWVGTDVPAHCSSLGKVLYAYGALQVPEGPLEPLTERSLRTGEALRAALARVRRVGYATTVDELEPGLTGVAAPVRRRGVVVAALGVSAPTSRLAGMLDETGALVARHARTLSDRLDHPEEGAA